MKTILLECCAAMLALSVQQPSDWSVAYDGHGKVSFETSGPLRLRPSPAETIEQTHAALVLSRHVTNLKYFELEVVYTNLSPLRVGPANPWEVFWLFFNYRASNAGKKTNYLVLKTNGLEIGRATGEKDQTILKTWASPQSTYGKKQTLKIRRMGTRMTVQVNTDEPILYDFSHDNEQPFSDGGAIGLYSEDAEVAIEAIHVHQI